MQQAGCALRNVFVDQSHALHCRMLLALTSRWASQHHPALISAGLLTYHLADRHRHDKLRGMHSGVCTQDRAARYAYPCPFAGIARFEQRQSPLATHGHSAPPPLPLHSPLRRADCKVSERAQCSPHLCEHIPTPRSARQIPTRIRFVSAARGEFHDQCCLPANLVAVRHISPNSLLGSMLCLETDRCLEASQDALLER